MSARLRLLLQRLLCALVLLPGLAQAERLLHATPDSYRDMLRSLRPGDTLVLAAGEYLQGLPLRSLHGSAAQPIVITGSENGPPAILVGREGQITVSLIDVSHLAIRNLHLEGRGLRGHGIVAEGRGGRPSHHITLEHLHISGFNASQAFNGISTKTPAWNWVIRGNTLRDLGTGLYLGNSDGQAPFIGGLIEGNRIERTLGYNMQIKHQQPRPALPVLPEQPNHTTIRYNLFDKREGSAAGPQARPNLLLGHWPLQGPGQDDRYLVYGNLFIGHPHERLLQGEGRIAAYANLFFNPVGEGVSFQPHNALPRDIHFSHNTVLARGRGVRISGAPEDAVLHFAHNLVFAATQSPLPGEGNHLAHIDTAADMLIAPDKALAQLDLSPRAPLPSAATPAAPAVPALPDSNLDFNARPRSNGQAGAYGHSGPTPGPLHLLQPQAHACGPCAASPN